MRSALIVLLVLATGAVVYGCSGGTSSSDKTATARATAAASATVSGSPAANPTPGGTANPVAFATPAVSGATYTFAQKGYAIDAPDKWTAQPNQLFDRVNATYPADAFFSPDTVSGIQPSVSVTCMKPRADQTTTEALRDFWEQHLAQTVQVNATPRAVTVDGATAYAFDYVQAIPTQTQPGEAHSVAKTDVVLVHGDCRWLISLSAPVDQAAQFRTTFDRAVASFKFLS